MEDNKTGGFSHTGQNLETEGLSGIILSIEDRNLKVDGVATCFRKGIGTQKDPLMSMPMVAIQDALENARAIAKFAEEFHLQRTMYLDHNGWLLGVDSEAHVQLVKGDDLSESELKNGITFIGGVLDTLRASE